MCVDVSRLKEQREYEEKRLRIEEELRTLKEKNQEFNELKVQEKRAQEKVRRSRFDKELCDLSREEASKRVKESLKEVNDDKKSSKCTNLCTLSLRDQWWWALKCCCCW